MGASRPHAAPEDVLRPAVLALERAERGLDRVARSRYPAIRRPDAKKRRHLVERHALEVAGEGAGEGEDGDGFSRRMGRPRWSFVPRVWQSKGRFSLGVKRVRGNENSQRPFKVRFLPTDPGKSPPYSLTLSESGRLGLSSALSCERSAIFPWSRAKWGGGGTDLEVPMPEAFLSLIVTMLLLGSLGRN